MGLDFSFELLTSASSVDPMLHELARHLRDEDAERLRAALPWKPEIERELVWGSGRAERDRRGVAGLRGANDFGANHACLSFAFRSDPELERWDREHPMPRRGPDVLVGCVWTELYVGEEHALLVATAATSSMSRLFRSSTSIRETWSRIAADSRAIALFFDTEDAEWECLWPRAIECFRISPEGYRSNDYASLRVDPYCDELLRTAGIRP